MSLAHRAVRGTMFVAVGDYAIMLMSFAATVVLARTLEPRDFGIYALAFFFLTLSDMSNKLGLDYALIHRQDISGAVLPTHLFSSLACSGLTFAIAGAIAVVLPLFNHEASLSHGLMLLAAFSSVQALGSTSRFLLEKELRFLRVEAVMVTATAVSSLVGILLAWRGWGVWSLFTRDMASMVLVAVGCILASPWRFWDAWRAPRRYDFKVAKWFLRFGAAISVAAFASISLYLFDNFLVGTIVGASALGFYDRAYRFANLPTGLVTRIAARSALPVYAKVQDEREKLSRAFNLTLHLIITLSLPLALVLFATAPEFVRVLLGKRWADSVPLMRLLIVFSLLRPLLDDAFSLLVAVGRPTMTSILRGSEAITLAALAIPLTFAFQAKGTAVAVDLAFGVGLVVAYAGLRRSVDVAYREVFVSPVLAAVASVAAWLLLRHATAIPDMRPFFRLVLYGGAMMAVYGLVILAVERQRFWARVTYLWGLIAAPQQAAPADVLAASEVER